MANPGQPTISQGATGDVVKRLQRALRRTPDPSLAVGGDFGPATDAAVREFQGGERPYRGQNRRSRHLGRLAGRGTEPTLEVGSSGPVVSTLQTVLTNGAGQWGGVTPEGIDGQFGPNTKVSVEVFQTWTVSLHAASATLETEVWLQFVVG